MNKRYSNLIFLMVIFSLITFASKTFAADSDTAIDSDTDTAVDSDRLPESNLDNAMTMNQNASDYCKDKVWELRGASTESKSGNVTYLDEWTPLLEDAVNCSKNVMNSGFCVKVQGQYDNVPFPKSVIATFGSQRAAQLARATARAAMVSDRLRMMGIDGESIQMLPPPAESTFRGASILFDSSCKPVGDGKTVVLVVGNESQIDEASVGDVVTKRLQDEDKRKKELEEQNKKPSPHEFFADVSFKWVPLVIAPSADSKLVNAVMFGASMGWNNNLLYARISGDGGIGTEEEYKASADFNGAFGYYHRPWLNVGVFGGMHFAWPGTSTWLHRSWFVGVEGTHCFLRNKIGFGEVCIREAFAPIGKSLKRLELQDDGSLVRINEKDDYSMRFELGVMFRFLLIKRNEK
ncbi:MAG: hypothetical protein JXR91_07095 [Deltaproteobacteria bacterium]|nr:hypothetical protein [Deltaproteobacteria bacterium]